MRRIPVWAFLAGRRKGKLAVTAIAVLGWTVGALSPGVSAQGVEGSGGNVRVFSVSCADRGQGEFGLTVAMLPGGVRELLGAGGSRMLGRGGEDWSKCGMVSFSTSCVPKEDESENREGDGRGDGGGGRTGELEPNKCSPVWGRTKTAVVHAFSAGEMAAAYREAGVALVVGHGIGVPSKVFEVARVFTEVVPVFVSPDVGIYDISVSQLEDILKGKSVRWSDLGSASNDRIQVYLHGGHLQRPKFEALLRSKDIELGVESSRLTYGADYADLRDRAIEGGNALVLGLRSVAPADLRMVTLNGKDLTDTSARESYPWVFPVYLAKRRDMQGEIAERRYMEAMEARQWRDLVFVGE